jgi:hypothetical protein
VSGAPTSLLKSSAGRPSRLRPGGSADEVLGRRLAVRARDPDDLEIPGAHARDDGASEVRERLDGVGDDDLEIGASTVFGEREAAPASAAAPTKRVRR